MRDTECVQEKAAAREKAAREKAAVDAAPAAPPGWAKKWSADQRKVFYHNAGTNTSVWSAAEALAKNAAAKAAREKLAREKAAREKAARDKAAADKAAAEKAAREKAAREKTDLFSVPEANELCRK